MKTSLSALRITLSIAALAICAPSVLAQAPKVGGYYKDSTSLGFRIKTPKKWEFIPPQPDDKNLIGKYEDGTTKFIQLGSDASTRLSLGVWLVKFDNRPLSEEEQSKERYGEGLKTLDEWLERHQSKSLILDSEKEKEIGKTPATLREYIGKQGGEEYRIFTAEFELEPDVKVAFVGNGPGDTKKWRKYETTFTRMVRAFKRIEVSRADKADSKLGMGSLRNQKRAKLEAEMARAPGWELYETDNYFVVTNNEDKAFITELMDRLEAIRKTYEELYPPTLAEEIRQEIAAEKARGKLTSEGSEEDDEEPVVRDRRSSAGRADPMELSRSSVVRVCKDRAQYHSYGGPQGSAGYWSSYHEELVIYDDKAGGGRGDTWITLNHEAFHQYIFYFFGNLAPHSWYNEGNGDFFSGYQLKNGRFKLKKNSWREGTIKEAIREGSYVPLKKIVKYTQREYYANAGLCYAQGWSLIWFLRTGEENHAKGWNDDWNGILTEYLRTLAITGDLEIAVEKAFEGVDWDEMEECWKAYIG